MGVRRKKVTTLRKKDQFLAQLLKEEQMRQESELNLIASENFVSAAVREAAGSVLTNKYAEGYPHNRFYQGCRVIDEVEELACKRAEKLFGAEHANVQPHSGSQANMAVYLALLEPGDTILGMSLSSGGHLTHGLAANFSGRLFNVVSYGVAEKTQLIDYGRVAKLARECRPKLIIAGASAYPRTIDFAEFGAIAKQVGAYLMADIAHIAGLVATGCHPDPVPYADAVTTTTHKTLRGPRGGMIVCPERYAAQIDRAVFPGTQGGPLMHIIAAKAAALGEALKPEFKTYCSQIVANAKALAEELLSLDFDLVTRGTDNHIVLIDLTRTGITGKVAAEALQRAGIVVNKNSVPFDKRSPWVTSGIRLGTPALTTRGMKQEQMRVVARLIKRVLSDVHSESVLAAVKQEVKELCDQFPIPY
ncbi:MAG: serine hydroxymethyltransferase [Candidatus Latescibacteria bacterium]|nr:serine hydroxymethyltransferase [Candidatus Latescibacterota bacterium]